jgi:predicted ABC-type transport system involved in lysophospholipase L1 biosynthesis ATPase subunit
VIDVNGDDVVMPVFQAYNLIPTLTALENIRLPRTLLAASGRAGSRIVTADD